MTPINRFIFLCLLTVVIFNKSTAQSLSFRTYPNSTTDLHSKINVIFEDNSGFLWIGTDKGCLKNNGENFSCVSRTLNVNSFQNTQKGDILAGSDSGIIRINKWGRTTLKQFENSGLVYLAGTAGTVGIWCLTSDKISYLDENLNELDKIKFPEGFNNSQLFQNRISSFAVADRKGQLYIYQSNRLIHLSIKKNKISSFSLQVIDSSNTVLLSKTYSGDVWMMKLYKNRSIALTNLTVDPNNRKNYQLKTGNPIDGFTMSSSGTVFLCGNGTGLIQLDLNTGRQYVFRNNLYDEHSIPDNTIQNCYEGRNQRLWIATKAGLAQSQALNTQFKYFFFTGSYDKSTLEQPIYTDVGWVNDSTVLLFNSGKNAIIRLNTGKGGATYITPKGNRFPDRILKGVLLNNHNWLISAMNGNFIYNDESDQIHDVSVVRGLPDIFSFPSLIKAAYKDLSGNLYLSVYNHSSVYKYISHENRWIELSDSYPKETENYIPIKSFTAAAGYETKTIKQDCFINDFENSIILFDHSTERFTKLPIQPPAVNRKFTDITSDSSGKIWMITNKSLYKCVFRNGCLVIAEINNIGQFAGNESLKRILCTGSKLWITTTSGLIRFDIYSEKAELFDSNDGLIDESFGSAAVIKNKSGQIISTTTNGLLLFDPLSIIKTTAGLTPVISQMETNGKVRDPEEDNFTFSYSDRNIRFQFSYPEINPHHPPLFSYKLEGLQDQWSLPSIQKSAEFNQLPAGRYTLFVRVSADGNQWMETTQPFSFKVNQPIYLHPLFILSLILISIAGVFIYQNEKQKNRLKQFMIAQELRNSISRDLHDDLGSALSSISFISDMGQQSNLEKSKKYHQLIGETSRTMIDSMNDIVWVVNPKNDSIDSLIYRLRRFSSTLFEARGIKLLFKHDETLLELHLPMNKRRNVYLICKEIVNNAAKHSGAAEVSITLHRAGTQMQIRISDNGNGFDTNQQYQGNGLNNLKSRALEINALLKVSSIPGQGSIFELTVESGK